MVRSKRMLTVTLIELRAVLADVSLSNQFDY